MTPVLTIAALVLPLLGAGGAFFLGGRTPGLAAVAVFVFMILGGALLGALSSLLALVRGEPWRALQLLLLLANVGVASYVGMPFLRGRPVPPIPEGERAFLALAPVPARLEHNAVVLGYPAPDSPETQRGYVIGERDARGIVPSLRVADYALPLKPVEFRLQLAPVNGRWTFSRDTDYLRGLSDRQWRQAAYLELRVNTQGWGIPVGIADQELRPIGPAR
jgi:hypothetical protein